MNGQDRLPLRERRPTSYTGDDEIERCMNCDGFVKGPGAKCKRCANRVKAAKEADRAATKAAKTQEKKEQKEDAIAAQTKRWRSNTMNRYIRRLLATKSGSAERQKFFERNPIADIFK